MIKSLPHYILFLAISLWVVGLPLSSQAQRQMSEVTSLYTRLEKGVVSVVTAGHGSGFLVDKEGIIITNNHVVNDAGKEMMIRFGEGKVVTGKVVYQERQSDLAIVLVNLENIKDYTVLEMFTPPHQEPLVYPGEKIFAIGSPISWKTLEKTLTDGIASKLTDVFIMHNVNINPGNSGGPLFNFDGQVIGVNTFIRQRQSGPGVSGSMSILLAKPMVEAVKAKLKSGELVKPSPELLPDYPTDIYPLKEIFGTNAASLAEHPETFKLSGGEFEVIITTPVSGYKQKLLAEEKLLAARKKRATKRNYALSDDEYASKNETLFEVYSLEERTPIVKVIAIPKTKLTTSSKVNIGLSFLLEAATGVPAPVNTKREYKADFEKITLVDASGKEVCKPVLKGKQPSETLNQLLFTDGSTTTIIDKTYVGIYEYMPECFSHVRSGLGFRVTPEGESKPSFVSLPMKTQRAILQDFKPYWQYKHIPLP
jgi:hypothetical protein